MKEGRVSESEPNKGGVGNYTQVNIMFPSSEVELPPAEKFNAFQPEAQKAILIAFRNEQQSRHAWLKQQQSNDHELNTRSQAFRFISAVAGTVAAAAIVIILLVGGIWLLKVGISAYGVALILAAIGGVVGTAVYGHNANRVSSSQGQTPSEHHKKQESLPKNSG